MKLPDANEFRLLAIKHLRHAAYELECSEGYIRKLENFLKLHEFHETVVYRERVNAIVVSLERRIVEAAQG